MSPMIIILACVQINSSGDKFPTISQVINHILGRSKRVFGASKAKELEISLGLQGYDPNFSPPDTVILQPELHVKTCSLCYELGHTTMDFPELCLLCINTGDCSHIMAGRQWQDHPDYIIAEEDLPNFDALTTIVHHHFALILLKRLAKDNDNKKGMELEKLKPMPNKGSLHELLANTKIPKTLKFDNVASMPAPDPRKITVVDEEWSERRSNFRKGHQVWNFYCHI
jgi:hypothetical protein